MAVVARSSTGGFRGSDEIPIDTADFAMTQPQTATPVPTAADDDIPFRLITPVLRLDSREQVAPVRGGDDHRGRRQAAEGRRGTSWLSSPRVTPGSISRRTCATRRAGGRLSPRRDWRQPVLAPVLDVLAVQPEVVPAAGFGEHEGDWELRQLGCPDQAGNDPILMTFSQHGGGAKREFWSVELIHGQPVVTSPCDCHANYPTPIPMTDQADGDGEALQPLWRDFGELGRLPGPWGNSENCPDGLSAQTRVAAPHAWHSQARG